MKSIKAFFLMLVESFLYRKRLESAKTILKRLYDEEDKRNGKVSNEAYDDACEPMINEPLSSEW